MDDKSRENLDRILGVEPAALTEPDREFLQARRSYLTQDQRELYGITEPGAEESKPKGKLKE